MSGNHRSPGWLEILQELRPVLGRLPRYVHLTRLVLRDGVAAPGPRRVLMGGLAYLLSPIDPVPGFLPIVGQLDDLLVALYTLRAAVRALPPDVRVRTLASAGLDEDTLERDLATGKRVAARLAIKAGRDVARVATRAGRWIGRAVASVGRRGLRKVGHGLSRRQARRASPPARTKAPRRR